MLIVLVFIVAMLVYFQSMDTVEIADDNLEFDTNAREVETVISECLKKVSIDGIELIAANGGYISTPYMVSAGHTSYWSINHANVQPSLGEIKSELKGYVETHLERCMNMTAFTQRGISLSTGTPDANIVFAEDEVQIVMDYPVKIIQDKMQRSILKFSADLEIRMRRIFEMATQVNNMQLKATFNPADPFDDVNQYNMNLSYTTNGTEITYFIQDPLSTEQGVVPKFTFATLRGNSTLTRTIQLQPMSSTQPVIFPNIIYSADQQLQLILMPGVLISHEGQDVDEITVEVTYPSSVTRYDVPMHELADNTLLYDDITWELSYPMYNLEPTGLNFSYPQRLALYYAEGTFEDENRIVILYGDGKGNWTPIPSQPMPNDNYIYTDIVGFSNYTIFECSMFTTKTVSTESELEPSGSCYVTLVVIIIIVIILIIVTWGAAAAASTAITGAAGSFGGVSASLGTTVGYGMAGSAFTIGTSTVGISVMTSALLISAGLGVVGGAMINAEFAYGSPDIDTIAFTTNCNQTLTFTKTEDDDASGTCYYMFPNRGSTSITTVSAGGTTTAGYGERVIVKSSTSKCGGMGQYLCGKCSTTCGTSYT